MQTDNQAGWYALYLSITQNISPTRAISAMEGKRKGLRRLTWEEFLEVYRNGEASRREEQRRRNNNEKVRSYQREYRRLHPLTDEQKKKRNEYMKKYRAKRETRRRPVL